jgi:hypothetical protein
MLVIAAASGATFAQAVRRVARVHECGVRAIPGIACNQCLDVPPFTEE